MNTSPTFLVLQAFGTDKPGALECLSKACAHAGCQILDSRWVVLGDTFSFGALLRGTWSAVAKLEAALPKLEKKLESSIIFRRTELSPYQSTRALPYSVEVISAERPGVIRDVTSYLVTHKIGVVDMQSETYTAPRTNLPMLLLKMTISIPAKRSISAFRDDFLNYCEEHQLDAVMEPYKY